MREPARRWVDTSFKEFHVSSRIREITENTLMYLYAQNKVRQASHQLLTPDLILGTLLQLSGLEPVLIDVH